MRVFGMGAGEGFVLLITLVVFVAIIAVFALVMYWIVRKGVCAGMRDWEAEKRQSQLGGLQQNQPGGPQQ